MARTKGSAPPQGNHPDHWPELTEQEPAGQPQQALPQGAAAPADQAAGAPGAPGYHMPQQHQPQTAPPPQSAEQHPQTYGAPPQYTQPPHQPQHTPPPPPQHTAPPQYIAPPQYTASPDPHPGAGAAEAPQADYSTQFDRYAPPPALSPQPGAPAYDPAQAQAPPHAQPLAQHPQAAHPNTGVPATDPHIEPRGTIQEHHPQSAPVTGQPQSDPQGYDLGHYMPAGAAGAGAVQTGDAYAQPGQHPHQPARQPQMQPEWSGQEGLGAAHAAPVGQQAEFGGFDAGHAAAEPAPAPEEAFEEDEDYDEPRKGGRGLLIATALVGAIALGGGLAYAYKYLGPGVKTAGGPKLIKAKTRPAKVRPKRPGGKSFANNDKKFLNRLGGRDQLRVRVPGASPKGVRPVRTLVVSPNGKMVAPTVRRAVPVPANPVNRLAVPGVHISGLPPLTGAPRVVPQPAAIAAVAPKVMNAPRVQLRPSTALGARLPKAKPLVRTTPVRRRPPAVKKTVVARAPRVQAGASAGYVAWISSSKDRLRSLGEFATLQQKYGAALAGKQPEIEAIDLGGTRGVWYRLRIGPPASKESTRALCKTLLDGKGVKQCFIRRF